MRFPTSSPKPSLRRLGGFTLVETLVTLAIVSVLMLALYTLLDRSGNAAKQETHIADAQEASRTGLHEMARLIRESRLGYLSYSNAILPFANNSGSAGTPTTITDTGGTSHNIRPGTDAIEVRGVFFTSKYYFAPGDIVCAGGDCTGGSNDIEVTIRQSVPTTSANIQNYPLGGAPDITTKTRDFYFSVASTKFQPYSVGANTYQTPLYYVGRVSANGTGWYQKDVKYAPSITFHMDATDAGARALNATNSASPVLQKPMAGGAVDVVVFYVDEGTADYDPPGFTGIPRRHPFLAQALFDPLSGGYSVQPLVDEVEDFQVAYGIDGKGGGTKEYAVSTAANKLSPAQDADEWVYDAAAAAPDTALVAGASPLRYDEFIDSTIPSAPPLSELVTPNLRAVYIAIATKSQEPDIKWRGVGAFGFPCTAAGCTQLFPLFDSTAIPEGYDAAKPTEWVPFHRRLLRMAVGLRNFS